MNHEALAFVNHQLAGMLRSGIPLEGALRQLCRDMQHGPLRAELEQLEAALAQGIPLREALEARKLPELYVRMILLGAQSNDLPGALTLVADHYQRHHLVWTRLKGLLVYPILVLVAATGLSFLMAFVFKSLTVNIFQGIGVEWPRYIVFALWIPAWTLAAAAVTTGILTAVPRFRRALLWKLPGFKEHFLSHLASTLALALGKGCHLEDALALARRLETDTPIGPELARWQERLAAGHARFADIAAETRVFPPLFVWLVAQGGEDLAAGFRKAAEIYHRRAAHQIELFLYAILPVSVLGLGLMILIQVAIPVSGLCGIFGYHDCM